MGFAESPYLAAIPAYGACDVVVTPANAATTLAQLNDPAKRVFCVDPGDYRSAGELLLLASGTQTQRRFLRYRASDGVRNAVQRAPRALFESIRIGGSWWVVQGLTIQPRSVNTAWFLSLLGADHVVIDGNLLDGVEHAHGSSQSGIVVAAYNGDSASFNSLQANVVRNGNRLDRDIDYFGILIRPGFAYGENNDFNAVLDNEIYDWGDGIALGSVTSDCSDPGIQHGTRIDGNDVYLTAAKWIDCNTGAHDPNGDCACAENAVDVKPDPGAAAGLWTVITHNRMWGFRPTAPAAACGGSGSTGYAVGAGGICAGHALVAWNFIAESTIGINLAGSDWIVAGNLIHDIRVSNGRNYGSLAIFPSGSATDLDIEFNTVAHVDNAYDDQSANTNTRCNAVIDNRQLMSTAQPRGLGHVTAHNFLYQSPGANFVGATNQTFATAAESQDGQLCYWRKRWTAPERICVPNAATRPASPHAAAAASCNENLTTPFGLPPVTFVTAGPTCGLGAELVVVLVALTRIQERRKRGKERGRSPV